MESLVDVPGVVKVCQNLVGGTWQPSSATEWRALASPWSGAPLARLPLSPDGEVDAVVAAAAQAFESWRATPLKERTQHLFAFRTLLLQHLEELSHLAAAEAGKTVAEARAGVQKGIEVIEYALSIQNLDEGGALEVSRGVLCQVRREPLGVVAGIVPFNFPAMVPLWMFPIAITAGNAFVMKPAEKAPLTVSRMAELMVAAGYPPGVFSIVQGARATAQALALHPQVAAVAFVGSTAAAREVYTRATAAGKRALCLGGAKNHMIIVPDADPRVTAQGVVASFTGCAGQRCMAGSVLIAVGPVEPLIDAIVAHAAQLRLGHDMGALIDGAAVDRLKTAIAAAEAGGARLRLDGRDLPAPAGYEGGHWLGPTIIDGVTPAAPCAREELFGPVLSILRVDTLEQALALEKANPYGNATSVFTTSGAVARRISEQASSGMIGINVGVPVPREPFSFGGTKQSRFGHGDITGQAGLDFWTDLKKITSKWEMQSDSSWMS